MLVDLPDLGPVSRNIAHRAIVASGGIFDSVPVACGKNVFLTDHRTALLGKLVDPVEFH